MRRLLVVILGVLGVAGCQTGYYMQLARGQYELVSRREPIDQVLARGDIDAKLRARLERALDARRFATAELGLPDNGSYRAYADLGRPYALWNVFATPEFSMAPRQWCYWLAGCMAYRGFYSLSDAHEEQAALRAAGFDTHVGGVPAYSTLGWFDDPVLNTILITEEALVGTIFHELTHQLRYVKGDTAFNESLATFVERQGLRQYYRDEPARLEELARRQQRDREFVALMLAARGRLEKLYAEGLAPDAVRARKAREFERLRADYAAAKARWGGDDAYDGWLEGELNNARLLPFGLYHQWVPAFTALFAQSGQSWPDFHRRVGEIAAAEPAERTRRLARLAPPA